MDAAGIAFRFAFGLIASALLSGPTAADQTCAVLAADLVAVRLAGVDAHGDIILRDGRRVRLVGLAPRQSPQEVAKFEAALAAFRERDLQLAILAEPDRWARLPVRLIAAPDKPKGEAVDLALALLRTGAAWHLPEPLSAPCDELLRQAGRQAASSDVKVVNGHDMTALKAHSGRIIILEGRIASVGERPHSSYLNFSRRRGEGASIVMSKRLWREMLEAGWTVTALTGKRVRVRGVLGGPDGNLIELAGHANLEVIK